MCMCVYVNECVCMCLCMSSNLYEVYNFFYNIPSHTLESICIWFVRPSVKVPRILSTYGILLQRRYIVVCKSCISSTVLGICFIRYWEPNIPNIPTYTNTILRYIGIPTKSHKISEKFLN